MAQIRYIYFKGVRAKAQLTGCSNMTPTQASQTEAAVSFTSVEVKPVTYP